MYNQGKPLVDLIEQLQAQRTALLIAAAATMPLTDYVDMISRYHTLGVSIFREKKARGEFGPPINTLGTEYIIPVSHNKTPYN